jgi:hypothetical protein
MEWGGLFVKRDGFRVIHFRNVASDSYAELVEAAIDSQDLHN